MCLILLKTPLIQQYYSLRVYTTFSLCKHVFVQYECKQCVSGTVLISLQCVCTVFNSWWVGGGGMYWLFRHHWTPVTESAKG